jgi:hypothetical protein
VWQCLPVNLTLGGVTSLGGPAWQGQVGPCRTWQGYGRGTGPYSLNPSCWREATCYLQEVRSSLGPLPRLPLCLPSTLTSMAGVFQVIQSLSKYLLSADSISGCVGDTDHRHISSLLGNNKKK